MVIFYSSVTLIYRLTVASHLPSDRLNYKNLTINEQCLCLIRRVCASRRKWFLTGKTYYRDADKSLARPGRKQATATEDFEFYVSYL